MKDVDQRGHPDDEEFIWSEFDGISDYESPSNDVSNCDDGISGADTNHMVNCTGLKITAGQRTMTAQTCQFHMRLMFE